MAGDNLQWLARAFERHLVMLASRGYRKSGECFPFEGTNETTIMLFADRIFTGLGFQTWPECKMYEVPSQRLDLWAESPDGCDPHMIEGKVVWDSIDFRLNRTQFWENRVLLDDFERLQKEPRPVQKIVIWVGFSPTHEIVSSGTSPMRLGDALAAVATEYPAASLQAQSCIGLETYCDCDKWKFAHVFCWSVTSQQKST
jgi:hypothetical protein